MASSETDIANLALSHIGGTNLSNIDDSSPKALIVRQFYDQALEEVLRAYDWACATRRQELAAVDGDLAKYAYRYALPADPYCLRVLTVFSPETGEDLPDDQYIIEGRELLTDATPLSMKYMAKLTNVSEYDSLFTEALSFKLAAYLAFPITKKAALRGEMLQLYLLSLGQAEAISGSEMESPDPLPTEWGNIT